MQAKQVDMLKGLSASAPESLVAVVTMTGTCCPVTTGHIQGFKEARGIILDESPKVKRPANLEHFDAVIGLLAINPDDATEKKLKEKEEQLEKQQTNLYVPP